MSLTAIDVSKEKLDVFYDSTGKHEVIANNIKSINKLINKLKKQNQPRLVFEASGGYDRLLKERVLDNGIDCSICNGKRVREFARSQGKLAKTDKIDAFIIAQYAKKTELATLNSRNRDVEDLRALNTRRRQVLDIINQEENKLEFDYPKIVTRGIKSSIRHLKKELDALENEIKIVTESNEDLKFKKQLLETIPGFGTVVTVTLLSSLPELGSLSKSQIANLAGLAPLNKDSGKYSGQRRVGHSRRQVKAVLYMAALSAIRHNKRIKQFYNKLIAKGKKSKVALVACMRKLVIYANAMLKQGEEFKV